MLAVGDGYVAQVTRDPVRRRRFLEHRFLDAAAIEARTGTAGMEAATRGRLDRARHVAGEDDALATRGGIGNRHRRQQRLGVRVLRAREQTRACRRVSTILPRYITATRWLMCSTTARSCATKRYDRPNSRCRSTSRLMTCAWTETSSADTGSSQTIRLGLRRQRAGDADALPLSAGKFVRILGHLVGAQARPCRAARATRSVDSRTPLPARNCGSARRRCQPLACAD